MSAYRPWMVPYLEALGYNPKRIALCVDPENCTETEFNLAMITCLNLRQLRERNLLKELA